MKNYNENERETIELFEFAELTEDVQNGIIEENRYINVDNVYWFDNIQDDFHKMLELLGFSDIQSNFSGFCNPGGGASFTAVWYSEHIVNNPEKWQSIKDFEYFKPFIDKLVKFDGETKIELYTGYYVHERTCFVDVEYVENGENGELESVLEELSLDCCNKYYHNLWAEYDYLMSDEAVKDYLLNDDYFKYTKHGESVIR